MMCQICSMPNYKPIYTPEGARVVHALRYDWTGWLRDNTPFPDTTPQALAACRCAWAADGLTLDTFQIKGKAIQCLFDTTPSVSPAFCAMRAKGRLQHALRAAATPVTFQRNIAIRTLGENTRKIVADYIGRQVTKSDYADPRWKEFLGRFTFAEGSTRLAEPQPTGHGRYWYNLHLVIVVQDRKYPMARRESFRKIREACPRIAAKKGYDLAEVSVMPDHIHIALRGHIEQSPMEIGLAFQNNLSFVMGYNRVWSDEFYVGTFSEYDIQTIGGTRRHPKS
jgi:REP element-mobilizing transposase RayT